MSLGTGRWPLERALFCGEGVVAWKGHCWKGPCFFEWALFLGKSLVSWKWRWPLERTLFPGKGIGANFGRSFAVSSEKQRQEKCSCIFPITFQTQQLVDSVCKLWLVHMLCCRASGPYMLCERSQPHEMLVCTFASKSLHDRLKEFLANLPSQHILPTTGRFASYLTCHRSALPMTMRSVCPHRDGVRPGQCSRNIHGHWRRQPRPRNAKHQRWCLKP